MSAAKGMILIMNKKECFYKDKTIIIVGGAGGIGKTIAQQLLKYNSNIVLLGRDLNKLEIASKNLSNCHYFSMDITNVENIKNAIDHIESFIGPIDISFNLAGYDAFAHIQDISPEDIIKTCRVNFEGSIFYTQYLLKKIIPREYGIIANVNAFSNGLVPFSFYSIDSASRAGVSTFFRSLREELSDEYPRIRFINFSPPITDTEAERARITSQVWERLNFKFHDTEKVVIQILRKISQGKDEIMTFDEKLLVSLNRVSRKLSRLAFFKKFNKISNIVLKNADIIN
ncbi:MAG: SDR family NAD(P)-dependent oxidoreductase [bacterium]